MPEWRPMSEFNPAEPAIVRDKRNDELFDWQPERYQRHYEAFALPFGPCLVKWNGLLFDGWKPPHDQALKLTGLR